MTEATPAPDQPVGPLAVLAFVAELALVAAVAYAGWHLVSPWPLSLLLAAALSAALVAVWGRWCAPRAAHRLPRRHRWVVKATLFAVALLLLLDAGPHPQAAFCGVAMWLLFVVSLPADRHA